MITTKASHPSVGDSTAEFSSVLASNRGLVLVAGLFLSIFVALPLAHLPWRFPILSFLARYGAVSLQSIAYVLILAAIQFPSEVLQPLKARYIASPPRLIIVLFLGLLFFYLYPAFAATVFLIVAIAILEAYEGRVSGRTVARSLLPAVYLFIGLVTVFAYNAVIVTVRTADYSDVFQTTDLYLLFGHSVSELAHIVCASVPHWITTIFMVSYFGLFAQIGAAILLLTVQVSRTEGMKFVSTILFAYLLSMLIFAAFPNYSPYFYCKDHAHSALPHDVKKAQLGLMALRDFRQRHVPMQIETEYYVAFPCMHIAQPVIVLWFLRRWRRVLFTLILVDLVLTFSIVSLEWHYVTDLLGGIAVAVVAISVVNSSRLRRNAAPAG